MAAQLGNFPVALCGYSLLFPWGLGAAVRCDSGRVGQSHTMKGLGAQPALTSSGGRWGAVGGLQTGKKSSFRGDRKLFLRLIWGEAGGREDRTEPGVGLSPPSHAPLSTWDARSRCGNLGTAVKQRGWMDVIGAPTVSPTWGCQI